MLRISRLAGRTFCGLPEKPYLYETQKSPEMMKLRRFLFLLWAVLPVAGSLCAQPVASLYDKAEYRIAMRDSVRLHTTVFTPKAPGKAPIIIFRTPYGTGPYGEGRFPDNFGTGYMRSYVDRGYIIVRQDVRGRYMSEGAFMHVRPAGFGSVDETTDSYDTVDWLVKNIPGNNGRVGFAGCSYPGFYALMGGLSGHPAVKAVSPQAPVTDWYMGDDLHHNGVLMLSDAVRFLNSMNAPAGHTPTETMPRRPLTVTPDERTFFLAEHPARADLTQLLAPNPFWEELAAHADYDEWWRMRDTRRACYNIRPAVLIVGGTFDAEDCYGAWNLYKSVLRQSARTPLHLVVGPWAHGAWRGEGRRLGDFDFGAEASGAYYMEHFEAPFFDCYLWARDTVDRLPPVAVFTSGDGCWHTFDRWTPPQARRLTLYLTEGGRLDTQRPAAKSSSTSYTSDPSDPVPYTEHSAARRPREYMIADQRFLGGRGDVLTFVTEPLTEDVTLAGPVEATLEVALSTTDADFVVKLIDVFPDGDRDGGEHAGMQMLVRGDVVRGRYRDGFAHPKAFVPGSPERVPFRTTDIAHTFRAGHRIMVQVQSSWFPLLERNPQQFVDLWHCAASDFVPCRVTLFHQRDRASSLTVYRL